MIPPEFAPTRTETQRTGDDIVTAVRNLRHDWPHMIPPGETQAPGRVKSEGAAQGGREEDAAVVDDFGRIRYPGDQSPEPGQEKWCPATDTDVRRIDKVLSLRAHITARLNGWCRVIIEDRGTKAGIPLGTDVPGMCEFVQRHAEWLGEHEAGSDCRDELREFAHRAHLIVSPPRRETMSIGRCPLEVPTGPEAVMGECGGDVRVRLNAEDRDGEAYASCSGCAEVAVATWWESRMFDDPETRRWLTDSDVVTLVHRIYGDVIKQGTVRQWVKRDVLVASSQTTEDGRRLFDRDAVVYALDLFKRRHNLNA